MASQPQQSPHYHGHRQRLREKLAHDSRSLPDYEIFELLLGQVLTRKDTKPLAKALLQRFTSFKGVLDARPEELRSIAGFGTALEQYWILLRELLARYAESPMREREELATPEAVAHAARSRLAGCPREEVWVAYVDTRNRLLSWEMGSKGSVDKSTMYPRDILERALLLKASGIIVVHNHPGGSAEASGADLQLTEHLRRSAQTVGVRLLDHVVVTDDACYSIATDRLL